MEDDKLKSNVSDSASSKSVKANIGSQSSKSIKKFLLGCFPLGRKLRSDCDIDSESDYVLINQSLFKVPKGEVKSCLIEENSVFEDASINGNDQVVERVEDNRIPHVSRNLPIRRMTQHKTTMAETSRRYALVDPRKQKIYDYIRRKTYERVNPYTMSPNDFLNNISSIFVENLKDPVPKDPFCKPKVFNRTRKKKPFKPPQLVQEPSEESSECRITFARRLRIHKQDVPSSQIKNTYKKQSSYNKQNRKATQAKVFMAESEDGSYSYKNAIERSEPYKEQNEKVLIWKIVVEGDYEKTN